MIEGAAIAYLLIALLVGAIVLLFKITALLVSLLFHVIRGLYRAYRARIARRMALRQTEVR